MSMRHPVDAPLSPEYRARYEEKQRQQRQLGEVYYDRLTHCEPSAYPRWIVEPYHKEFALSPNQTWLMQEFMNETRRATRTAGRTPRQREYLARRFNRLLEWRQLVIWTPPSKR